MDIIQWHLYQYTGSGLNGPSQKEYKSMLFQNYPNPTISTTRIRYILQEKGEVSLKIYNLAGQLVRILVEGKKEPDEYTVIWDGRNEKGEKVPSGSYFYRIVAGDYNSSKKLIMVR